MINEKELKTECSECSRRKFYQKGYEDCRREMIQEIIKQLKENTFDMSLENPDCKEIWIDKAIEIVKKVGETNETN